MDKTVLATRGLGKRYGASWVLKDVSAALEANRIYGLLGRNGAGKTTFLNCVTSRIFATEGEITAFGRPAVENTDVLPRICFMPEQNLFLTRMRVGTQLRQAEMFFPNFDRAYARRLCELFELDTHKPYRALSRGYESMLRIVIGLASRAELTIFDEPVLGLDAAMRDAFYEELLRDYAAHPRAFLISTHLIEESAELFERVLLIRGGRLLAQTTVEDLRAQGFYLSGRAEAVAAAAGRMRVLHEETVAGMRVRAVFGRADEDTRRGWQAHGVEVSAIPIQKLFVYLTDAGRRTTKEGLHE